MTEKNKAVKGNGESPGFWVGGETGVAVVVDLFIWCGWKGLPEKVASKQTFASKSVNHRLWFQTEETCQNVFCFARQNKI